MKKVYKIGYLVSMEVATPYDDYYKGVQYTSESIEFLKILDNIFSSEDEAVEFLIKNNMENCSILPFWIKEEIKK